MAIFILIAFVAVPLIEIALFIQVGGWIGLGWTLTIVVATAIIGTILLRSQGLATLERARRDLDQGRLPTEALFDGLCLLFAGALLLTPGFATDTLGLLLFVPQVRDALRHFVGRHIQVTHSTVMGGGPAPGRGRPPPGGKGPIIEGEFEELDEEPARRPKGRPEIDGSQRRP